MRQADSQPYYEALQQIVPQWDLAANDIALLRNGLNHVFAGILIAGTAVIIRITDDVQFSLGEGWGHA